MRDPRAHMHNKETRTHQIIRQGDKCYRPPSTAFIGRPLPNNKCNTLCALDTVAIFSIRSHTCIPRVDVGTVYLHFFCIIPFQIVS